MRALVACLLLVACAAPVAARDDYRIEPFRWRAEATPQARVVARNDYGDVRVRTAQHGALVVGAMVQEIGWTTDELGIRIDEGRDVVRIDVVSNVRAPRGRVDLTLIVPAGKTLHARTRDGIVEIKYRGEIVVETRDGAVTLDAPGPARVETRDGDVRARLTGTDAIARSAVRSRAGSVELHVPTAADEHRIRVESRRGTTRVRW